MTSDMEQRCLKKNTKQIQVNTKKSICLTIFTHEKRERVRGEETRQTISVDLHYYVDLITISLRNSRKIWFSPSIQLNSTQGT